MTTATTAKTATKAAKTATKAKKTTKAATKTVSAAIATQLPKPDPMAMSKDNFDAIISKAITLAQTAKNDTVKRLKGMTYSDYEAIAKRVAHGFVFATLLSLYVFGLIAVQAFKLGRSMGCQHKVKVINVTVWGLKKASVYDWLRSRIARVTALRDRIVSAVIRRWNGFKSVAGV